MKNVVMFFIALIAMSLDSLNAKDQQLRFDVGDTVYVCAYNGLNLRADANTNSEVIVKLDHAEEVLVLEVAPELIEIDHRKSNWMKVSSDGYTGYLFGGYLSTIEPLYLESYSFDCNTDVYYLDWISEVVGEAQIASYYDEGVNQNNSGGEVMMASYNSFHNGDVFYNKVGPQTDTYYFESSRLTYNDVLNFMEYMVACQNRFCDYENEADKAIFKPIKNIYGQLVRVDCTTPLSMTAQQKGNKMIVKLETCL